MASESMTDAEKWATISFALARDLNRIKRVCEQDHPPKMGSPTKDWPAGTETRHSDGTRCVLLEGGDYAILATPRVDTKNASSERAGCDFGTPATSEATR